MLNVISNYIFMLVIGAANNKLWKLFCEIIEMPELIDDPQYKTNVERVQNRKQLTKILQDRSSTRNFSGVLRKKGMCKKELLHQSKKVR